MKSRTLTVLLLILVTIGCSPKRNPSDLLLGSGGSGAISLSENIGIYSAQYGTEVGHPDRNRSDPRRHNQNLIIALFILMPKDNEWVNSGGGSSGRPWYYRFFYSARWLSYLYEEFVKPDADGNIKANYIRKRFSWRFDGRKRIVTIKGVDYPFSVGSFVLVKLDQHLEPEVAVGTGSFDKLQIPQKHREIILKCLLSKKMGISHHCDR